MFFFNEIRNEGAVWLLSESECYSNATQKLWEWKMLVASRKKDRVEKKAPTSSKKKLVYSVNQVVNCQNMTNTWQLNKFFL